MQTQPTYSRLRPRTIKQTRPPHQNVHDVNKARQALRGQAHLLQPQLPQQAIVKVKSENVKRNLQTRRVPAIRRIKRLPRQDHLQNVTPVQDQPSRASRRTKQLPRRPGPRSRHTGNHRSPKALQTNRAPARRRGEHHHSRHTHPQDHVQHANHQLKHSRARLRTCQVVSRGRMLVSCDRRRLSSLTGQLTSGVRFHQPDVNARASCILNGHNGLGFTSGRFGHCVDSQFSSFSSG